MRASFYRDALAAWVTEVTDDAEMALITTNAERHAQGLAPLALAPKLGPYTRWDLAEHAGITVEFATRIFAYAKKQRLVINGRFVMNRESHGVATRWYIVTNAAVALSVRFQIVTEHARGIVRDLQDRAYVIASTGTDRQFNREMAALDAIEYHLEFLLTQTKKPQQVTVVGPTGKVLGKIPVRG